MTRFVLSVLFVSLFSLAALAQGQYTMPMRGPDGALCFGPDTVADNLASLHVTCPEPWTRVERAYDSDWEPRFGWYCQPSQRFCSRPVQDGTGCACRRRDVLAQGWVNARSASHDARLGLAVAPEKRCTPYDRDDYRYPRSVEARIAERQGMVSLYTGHVFGSLKESDIEHVVALSEAHDSGLCAADANTRRKFARDLDNLTLALPRLNRYEKRAKDAGEWLPPRNRCWFARTVVTVKERYGLTVDHQERNALLAVLTQCEQGTGR